MSCCISLKWRRQIPENLAQSIIYAETMLSLLIIPVLYAAFSMGYIPEAFFAIAIILACIKGNGAYISEIKFAA
ncbi:MAG TPA: hypothetical protein VLH61_07270 [Bacteroidales bacterium]|nr:hypothetical protein [Bacteroidales bacterium]